MKYTNIDKVVYTTKYRAFIIDVMGTEDKEYCYPVCRRLDGSTINEAEAVELSQTIQEAIQDGKNIIDDFLDYEIN